mgnify:CR=1 FL=1
MIKKNGKTRVPKSQIAEKSGPIDLHIQPEVRPFCATELGFAPLSSKKMEKMKMKKDKKKNRRSPNSVFS